MLTFFVHEVFDGSRFASNRLKEVNSIAYRKKGDRDKAISDYCKALRIDPSDQTPSAI